MQNEVIHSSISMMAMFQNADLFMKFLILGLLFASVWCWAIIFDKMITLKRINESMKRFEEKFWKTNSLSDFYNGYSKDAHDPLAQIFNTAYQEWAHNQEHAEKSGLKLTERISKSIQITIDKMVEKLETRMIFLASTGSVAPLLGLFGTVWGIMDSFNAIGATQSTNIAAVAPGVAEALFTTAVGLIAAIPALIGYNKITHDIDRVTGRMETFSDELTTILETQRR